ncbi:hypothetical protein RRG08_056133 [Elysia crispata]|uniref:VWFA domain-containing protein n=1 Tax=Elysia crispata TaxID=231223 RepID=A0AAE0YVE6_9GAST|nr:hypothetical protein RRG08_056133 [Elysia crispata]
MQDLVSAHTVFSETYGDRETAPNFLIVISGSRSSDPYKTEAMLAPLARKGVTIYTIGVGASADEEELKTIAYPPIRVFHAENAQTLSCIKDQLVEDICRDIDRASGNTQQGTRVACTSDGVTADIFFVLDASHWVSESEFKHILDFVKSFVDSFLYGPNNVRVGMTPYSGGLNMKIHFKQFPTREFLYYGMNYIQYNGGDARLDRGLVSAHTVFSETYGDRETAPNFLIVISGGPLARKGVTIYTSGVGASAEEEELKTIAYPPIRVFHAENVQALSSIKDQLVGDICRDWNMTKSNAS